MLLALGEQIGQRRDGQGLRRWLAQPRAFLRLASTLARSRAARRPLLPKDLWSLQGIAIAGSDSALYSERIRQMWGRRPLEVYGCTEGLILALQTWDYQGMTFLPNLNFLEFIPEEYHYKAGVIPGYTPPTLLLDEVTPGENYELVITSLLGGCFVRYRLGDLVKITAQRNDALDIDLPQIVFYSRDDGLIDLAGFTRLTERTIAQALAAAGIPCRNWVGRREGRDAGVLHLYLEIKNDEAWNVPDLTAAIDRQLKRMDVPYTELESMLGLKPLQVTLLPKGSFQRCADQRRAAGVDQAQLRPSHLNPSDDLVAMLVHGTPVSSRRS